ncbi:MAG: metal ABC transporter ATP-binding protein [Clostridia bacterium]|nr:metal ABC transporter ATP-binding protein [Clostridia bacterium]
MNLLSVKNLSVMYDNLLAAENISFDVAEGDYICIVGENGSGKSTVLKGILGLVPLKSGTVEYIYPVSKTDIGYLPQQTSLQKDFPASVYEVVLSGCLNADKTKWFYNKNDKQTALKNMEKLEILELKNKSYRDLSGGQQQRVLLARALCSAKKLIMLDEPVTGLDPMVSDKMYQIISEINKKTGISVVMVSHDVESAVKYADKILHLDTKMQFFGTTSDYLSSDIGRGFVGGRI